MIRDILIREQRTHRWLRAARPVGVIAAHDLVDVIDGLGEVERAVERSDLHAVGFVAYEAAQAFDPALPPGVMGGEGHPPLLWFALCEGVEPCAGPSVPQTPLPPMDWKATVAREDYVQTVERIRRYIEAGDVYQVNFTYRLRAAWDDLAANGNQASRYFAQWAASQGPSLAAFIDTDEWAVCSVSPELFFQLDGSRLESRPMKGTAPRGLTREEDLARAAGLRGSEKERAENIMIVDMARNDIGRVARRGSVVVENLLAVEKYPTVWQMTTTVTGQTDATLVDVFRAMFPAASVTGTPKRRAMEIIAELETTPRGLYTGCIGHYAPGRQARFNVAIRTAVLDRQRRTVQYGLGSGIVWDAVPEAERDECEVKTRVLTTWAPEFSLLETLLWRPEAGYYLLDSHLRRLQRSASYFDFACNEATVRAELERAAVSFAAPRRVRLLLDTHGHVRIEATLVEPATSGSHVRVALAAEPIDAGDRFLYHKTTHRVAYDHALARRPDCDDVILWNQRGEVTESTRANVMVQLDGHRYTPPVSSGLLAGVYRERLLALGRIAERVITLSDLHRAERLWLMNSVRGLREAVRIDR